MRAKGLRIGPTLTLPIDLAVEATAVVGKRGRGKTFTAKRLVEEVLRVGVTVLVIDPTDVWWGLRSGADGQEGGGLDVVTVGGSHDPDLPVHEGSGKMLARLVLDGTSIVLSPKGLVKSARRRLVGELLAELYDRANGTPILVVIDEADEYAPEGARAYGGNKRDDPLVLASGAVEDIVRRGRAGGLGSLLITQRVAVLSKNVLEQSDTLIALGVTGKNDIDAVAGWIAKHAANAETAKQITASLPALPRGTAWVWSPEYDVLEQVQVLPITTFDSSRSPKVGEVAVAPKGRKAINLAALGEEMERFAAEVKADDPRELRKRITELERAVSAKQRELDAERAAEKVRIEEVRVFTDADERALGDVDETLERAAVEVAELRATIASRFPAGAKEGSAADNRVTARPETPATSESVSLPRIPRTSSVRRAGSPTTEKVQPSPPQSGTAGPLDRLSRSQEAILDTLAWFESVRILAPLRSQVAWQAGVSPRSSGFEKNCSTLRTSGLIHYPGPNRLGLTPEGRALATGPSAPATTEELQRSILTHLSGSQQAMVTCLLDAYPAELTRDELADRCGVSPRSSGFEKNCSTLRTLGLVDYPQTGALVATELLFID